MSFLKPSVLLRYLTIALLASIPATSFSQSTPLVIEPETESSGFRTDTFIPDFLGPGFVTVSRGGAFNFNFDVPAGDEGLYQIQVRHASNNTISILVDGTAVRPDLDLSTRTLGFWFDNEAYVTLAAGSHVISFEGPVFLDTFRITRTPPDANRFLTYPTSVNENFFNGSEENTVAYYNTIDPDGERETLNGFLEINGFTSGGVNNYDQSNPAAVAAQEELSGTDFSHAIYQNIADLDLGRRMFVLKSDNGNVASYVQNFATPDNALIQRNLLATVAMEYRPDGRLTTFYAYDSRGQRVTKVDLDGRGQKFVPTLCAACHGGKPKDDIDGVYQNGGNIGTKWIAWDLDNFEFSSRLSLEDQESEFRSMNQAVLCTTPSASNAELVRGWYSADSSSNCSSPLPEVAFNGEYVPDGWSDTPEHRELYLDVVRPSCRACHAQRGTYGDNTLLELNSELEFSTFEDFESYKDEIEAHVFDQATMPSALVTYESFWRSRDTETDQPEILDRVLFGGLAHVNPPASIYPANAQAVYGPRRQPGRPIAHVAETDVVTTGVEGRLNALASDFATNLSWSVTGGDGLAELPSNEPLLTITPDGEHEVTLSVSNFDRSYTDSTTVTINTDDEQRPSSVLFVPDVLNLLESSSSGLSCTSCHQPGGRANTVYHLAEPSDFLGGLTPEQFAYNQAITRIDCRDPESSLLLRRPSNPSHFGGALLNEGDSRWTLLRRWIAEGAPFDEERSFSETGSDCGVVINDPEYRAAEEQSDTGLGADYPRIIVVENTGPNSTAWVEFSDNTKQFISGACRQQLVDNQSFDVIPLTGSAVDALPNNSNTLSCDAIAALPSELINSVPAPVQPGLDLEIREFAVIPDNTSFGTLRLKPGLLALARNGERLFTVEQHEGKVWEFTNGVVGNTPWFNVHQELINQTGDGISGSNLFHGGLRSLAFHPEFATNGKVYTSHMRNRPDQREGVHYISDSAGLNVFTDSTVSEWTMDAAGNVLAHREVFRIGYPAEDHLMKQIMFNPYATPGSSDFGLLYIAHGDGTPANSFGNGQNDDALGKILRINPLADGDSPYSIPASNPFVNDDAWDTDEVFSMGFRNPHHIAFGEDGTIMVADVGRANAEEINLITAGSNHGWPDREGIFTHLKDDGGGFLTGIGPLPANDADFGFTYPAAQYGHVGSYGNPFTGHSIAGGFVVENGSAWDGQYLYGDFVSFGDVYHSTLDDMQSAVTQGAPNALTQAITQRARVLFDHDNNPSTDAQVFPTMLEVINNSPRYFSHSGSRRADIRFGQGPGGEIYIMNKRNNTIYLVTNTMGADPDVDPTVAPVFTGNVRSEVYSLTTAELFWDRATDNGFVQGYEIIRNGELLGIRDSLSLFEGDLDPAIIYNYDITAIDTDGNRSQTLTAGLSTSGMDVSGGNNPPNSTPDTDVDPTIAPVFPGNIRSQVYSLTSAELFWDRASDNGFVQGYEIIRNGESLGIRDSLSLFEGELDPAIIYNYAITAIDTDGNRSQTLTMALSTSGMDVNGGNNPPTGTPDTDVDPTVVPVFSGNVRHEVYSLTSAELFWDRATDNGFIQGYEIVRNGESLGIRDSLSLFEGDLDPALIYTYAITAIDTDNNRSQTLSITFSTSGMDTGNGNNNPPTNPGTSTGTAPDFQSDLLHLVYSPTSAELFWNRATDDGLVQGYEIIRNGESLGIRDSLSLFEGELDPAVTYTYAITAIDTDGNRSATSTITFATSGNAIGNGNGNGNENSNGNNPTPPGQLRHTVHSSTSAEISWDRATDNGFVQGYEIIRNGESLGIRDALSLFEGALDPSVTYTYQVTTIDNEGNRSTTASITLTTGDTNTVGSVESPTAPAGLLAQVHSATAAELSWNRATQASLLYEVQRDGVVVSQTDGTSFFDNSLSADTTYRYQIVSIDSQGNRSNASTIRFTTFPEVQ